MLDNLLNIRTDADFFKFSSSIGTCKSIRELYDEIAESSLLLRADDLMLDHQFDSLNANPNFISEFLKTTQSEKESARIVHNLQLVAYCNPGLRKQITRYLNCVCV